MWESLWSSLELFSMWEWWHQGSLGMPWSWEGETEAGVDHGNVGMRQESHSRHPWEGISEILDFLGLGILGRSEERDGK